MASNSKKKSAPNQTRALMNVHRRLELGSIKDLAKLLKDFSQTIDVFLNDPLRPSVREGFVGFSGPDEAGS